jgi:crotonobetainyl-CoA:carnitine CoA-transferase CaiB-like acyl-CoA transferase
MQFERTGQWSVPDRNQLGRSACDRLYRCQEGWLLVDLHQESEWRAFTEVVEHPEWAGDPRFTSPAVRTKHDVELTSLIAGALERLPASEWSKRCRAADVPAAQADADTFEDFMRHHGLLEAVSHPAFGDYWRTGPSIEFSDATSGLGPACGLGEHSKAILSELGYSLEAVQTLVVDGVIGSGSNKR